MYVQLLLPFFCRWLKDGQLIDESDGFKILLDGRKLAISRAQVSDTGVYRCVATNAAGDHGKAFEVTVHGMVMKSQENNTVNCLGHDFIVKFK